MVNKFLLWIDKHIIRLYWNTLRVHKKTGKWFSKGTDIVCVLTTKCNLHCNYCPMFLTDPKYPRFDVCTLDEWKEFFENYPEWISQVYLSGGEPSKVSYLSELTNWLIDRGHHVIIFSNLETPEAFYGIKNHWRFVLVPTFHQYEDDKERFTKAYNKLKSRFRIVSQEMEDEHKLFFTKHKNFFNDEYWFKLNTHLHAMPDTPRTKKMYLGCNAGYIDGKVKK